MQQKYELFRDECLKGKSFQAQFRPLFRLFRHLQYDAPGYFAFAQTAKNVVHGLDRLKFDLRLHLALAGEIQRLLQVLPRADDRAADSDAFQYDIKNRRRKIPGWKSDERAGAATADHSDPLEKSWPRDRGHHHSVHATEEPVNLGNGVGFRRVD